MEGWVLLMTDLSLLVVNETDALCYLLVFFHLSIDVATACDLFYNTFSDDPEAFLEKNLEKLIHSKLVEMFGKVLFGII